MGLFTDWIVVDIFMTVLFLFCLVYLWFQKRFTYWEKRGVYSPPTSFPAGNINEIVYGTLQIGQCFEKLYYENRTRPYFGIYMIHKYALVVNDPELIKTILVKEFMHFTDHGLVHNEDTEPLEGHLFNINGNRWRNIRVKLVPAFTSGKMKTMFETLVYYAKSMQDYIELSVNDGKLIDVKETLARYSTDIIGTCVFGLECNSLKPGKETKFREMSVKSQTLPFFKSLIQTMSLMAPWIVERLRTSMYQEDVNKFFAEATEETLKLRKEQKIERNDYLQILMKLWEEREDIKRSTKEFVEDEDGTMTMGDLAAQFFVFFVDGVETSSTAGSFAMFELARNPHIQDRLRAEIDETLAAHGGKLTYEALSDMKYLFQVVEESLRMYPPLPLVLRVCTKEFKIPETNIVIEKGTSVMIPIMGIQRDPDIFPEPMTFNPDRFSAENKAARHRFTHLPFGEGPRMCMGTRFGMLMARMGLVNVLRKYNISIDEPEKVKPFSYKTNYFILSPVKGIHLRLTRRTDK